MKMRTVTGIGIAAALLAAMPAQAMVPLHLQRQGALNVIIELPAIASVGPIDRIQMIAEHIWRVTAGPCHVDVTFVERQGPYPGRGLRAPPRDPHAGPVICQR
jgi:hypothetical protein